MAYNLAYLRNRVLNDKLDDPTYDPTIVDRFINDTIRSIFNSFELPFQEKRFDGTLPENAVVLSFPEDYQQSQSMVLVATDDTTSVDITDNYIDFREFNRSSPLPESKTPARPSIWTSYGNKLYLGAPTDKSYILAMFYLKQPKKLTLDEEVPELPEAFEEAIVLGTYYRILERNEDFDQAIFIKNGDYTAELTAVAYRYSKRQSGKTMRLGTPSQMTMRRRGRG